MQGFNQNTPLLERDVAESTATSSSHGGAGGIPLHLHKIPNYARFRFIPISPAKPEPKSSTVPGIGVAAESVGTREPDTIIVLADTLELIASSALPR